MKKTVITSALALGLGITGVVGNNSADASEMDIDKAELAELAQSNPEELNQQPLHEGSYEYDFNFEGVDYHFASNSEEWTWSYGEGSEDSSDVDFNTEEEVVVEQETTNEQPAEAPATEAQDEEYEAAAPVATENSNNASEESSDSSVEVNDHLKQIAERESGGDINAVNPSSGAAGKYQFLQSTWDSVAPSEYQGVSPADAPEHVQDAAAQKLYDEEGPSQWVTA